VKPDVEFDTIDQEIAGPVFFEADDLRRVGFHE
jgi:hypothetical protein